MKTRRQYTRDFKIRVVREIESEKSLAQVSRENGIHPSLVVKWKQEYLANPENAFSGNGLVYKEQARMAELERLVGRLYAENEFLKSLEYLREQDLGREKKGGAAVKYMIIKESLESGSQISVDRATRLLGVSRCGFDKWSGEEPVKNEDIDVRNEIQKVSLEYPAYGYRRITAELRNRGYTVNHNRVLRLMREENLLCVRKRFKSKTTDSDHNLRTYPNLINDLKITRLNQVWASDITYIRLPEEFVDLAVVLDRFNRRCIGWNLDRSLHTELALCALTMAIEERWNENMRGLIHHSDQGVHSTSKEYIESLKSHEILISMAAQGNPYDNAFVESFIRTLRYEEVYLNEYDTFSDALESLPRFIEEVYNKKRLHSSLG